VGITGISFLSAVVVSRLENSVKFLETRAEDGHSAILARRFRQHRSYTVRGFGTATIRMVCAGIAEVVSVASSNWCWAFLSRDV
jgi:hypothetical protein